MTQIRTPLSQSQPLAPARRTQAAAASTRSAPAAQNQRRPLRSILTFVTLLAWTAVANAHPGHSLSDSSAHHLLTSPDHLLVLALIGAGLVIAGRCISQRAARRFLQAAGVITLTAAAIFWGIR